MLQLYSAIVFVPIPRLPCAFRWQRRDTTGPDLPRWNRGGQQVSHAHQIVGGASEGKHPVNFQSSAMPHLAPQRNCLQPAETFFDALLFLLADDVARVPRGSRIDGAAYGHAPGIQKLRQHRHRGISFGGACSFPYQARHDQSVAILHQQIPAIAQPSLPFPLRASSASGSLFDSCAWFERFLAVKIRRATHFRVHLVELWRQLLENLINHSADRSQRMIFAHSLLWGNVAKHMSLLLIGSSHVPLGALCATWLQISAFFSRLLEISKPEFPF